MAGGERDARIRDLPLPRLPAQLENRLRDAGQVRHVVGRKQSATGVDWRITARSDMTFLDIFSTLAFGAPTIVFELKYQLCGKTIIELGDIDVLDRNSRLSKRRFFCLCHRELRVVLRAFPP